MNKIIITGNPIPKKRHRHCVMGSFVKTYDIQSKEKHAVSQEIKKQCLDQKLEKIEGYLDVEIIFFMPIPKSASHLQRNRLLWMEFPTSCDLDNLAKFYLDCSNNIVFNDDRQIISLKCQKYYSENPRTEIKIMPRMQKIEEEVGTILGIYGPNELCDFIEIAWQLGELYHADEHNDWVKEELQAGDDEVRTVRLIRTALLLSKMAHNHANLLKTIERKCPGFWQRSLKLVEKDVVNE